MAYPPRKYKPNGLHPREVADKSPPASLRRAIRLALAVESGAVQSATRSFNQNRYLATAEIEDYEALKDRARAIKENAIENLPALLQTLEAAVTARGGHFFLAKTGAEASAYIQRVCKEHGVRLVIKAKSITSEEIHLNRVLEAAGIEVAETDLAEFILQLADEQPSHLVAPAIHWSRERISALFKQAFDTDQPLDSGEELTVFARDILREKFLAADAGISGANLIAADSGTLMLVESEGNIRMATLAPPLHIALAGVEKVVPSREDLAPFIELLAASGTGQPLSSYTSLIRPPLDVPALAFNGRTRGEREFYLVLIDNGRLEARGDPQLKQTLYCIRCSACQNSCANFQVVGGHAYGGESYSGGIGASWEAITGGLEKARFSELCTGCSRCVPQCPVRIDIPWLNTVLRDRLNRAGARKKFSFIFGYFMPGAKPDRSASLQKQFFGHFGLMAGLGSRLAPLSNWFAGIAPIRMALEKIVGLDRRRKLPGFAGRSLVRRAAVHRKTRRQTERPGNAPALEKAALVADVYTNYLKPDAGMAALAVLEAVGVEVEVCGLGAEGRAALSQGLIATAGRRAIETTSRLEKLVDQGRDLVVVEPSVLGLFKQDYANLLQNDSLFQKLKTNCYDSVDYLLKIIAKHGLDPAAWFSRDRLPGPIRLFYHCHCQQKSVGSGLGAETLFRRLGLDVETSQVECCGMAGSFGYKKDYYDISMAAGQALFDQIDQAAQVEGELAVLAGGISCAEQILAGTGKTTCHPIEILARMLIR